MVDSGKMLKPRQIGDPSQTFGGPGPANPPTSSTPAPGLPLSESPFSTSLTTPTATPPASTAVTTETFTLGSTTITVPVSTALPSSSSISGSSSGSATTSAGSPAPTPSLRFAAPANATTCSPLLIRWAYANLVPTNLSLALVITNLGIVKRDVVNTTIIPDKSISPASYTWPAVTVPPGLYRILGQVDQNGPGAETPTFSVQAGSDTSCLSSQSGSGGGGTTSSNTSKGSNTGAIAGGTVGGLLLLACAGVALFFLCGLRKATNGKRTRTGRRQWGGLGSMDSKASRSHGVEPGDSNDYLGAGRESAMAVMPPRVDSTSSLEGEKAVPESSLGHDHGLPVLAPLSNWSHSPRFDTDSTGPGRTSVELARLPSRPAVPDSPRSSLDLGSDPFASTPNSNNRRSSRTPRKPVPTYNPTPEEIDAMAMARTRSDHSQHSRSSSGQQPSSSYTQPSPLSSASQHGDAMLHGLKSKSSGHFHEAVHYLIPDMPAPRAD